MDFLTKVVRSFVLAVGITLMISGLIMLSGCGGGSVPVLVVTPTKKDPPRVPENLRVDGITVAGEGDLMRDKYVSYDYQVVPVGTESVAIGVSAIGAYLDSSNMGGLYLAGVPIEFEAVEGKAKFSPSISISDDPVDLYAVNQARTEVYFPKDEVQRIKIKATVADPNHSSVLPVYLYIEVVDGSYAPTYEAGIDPDTIPHPTIVAGGTRTDLLYIKVNNVGTGAWYNFDNRLDRVWMRTSDSQPSKFYNSSSWYDPDLASSMVMYDLQLVLPGEYGYMYFYLSAPADMEPGEYEECFKIVGNIDDIDSEYYADPKRFDLVGGQDFSSEFCIPITVTPSEGGTSRAASATDDILFGRLYDEQVLGF